MPQSLSGCEFSIFARSARIFWRVLAFASSKYLQYSCGAKSASRQESTGFSRKSTRIQSWTGSKGVEAKGHRAFGSPFAVVGCGELFSAFEYSDCAADGSGRAVLVHAGSWHIDTTGVFYSVVGSFNVQVGSGVSHARILRRILYVSVCQGVPAQHRLPRRFGLLGLGADRKSVV